GRLGAPSAALRARLWRNVLDAYRPGGRGLRLRFPLRARAGSGARNPLMPAELIEAAPKYQGWSTLLVARIRLPDGRVVVREIEHHGRAACVLAFDPHRKTALFVRQVRAPTIYAAQPSP